MILHWDALTGHSHEDIIFCMGDKWQHVVMHWTHGISIYERFAWNADASNQPYTPCFGQVEIWQSRVHFMRYMFEYSRKGSPDGWPEKFR